VYTERFLSRDDRSGWFIQSKTGRGMVGPDLYDILQRTHVPTTFRQNADWNLIWFEKMGDPAATVRPDFAWPLQKQLPSDVLVDGLPVAERAHSEVWAILGSGWSRRLVDGDSDRRMTSPATLWIYSPEEMSAAIRVKLARVPRGVEVRIANGTAAIAEQDGTVSLSVELRSGWNEVVLTASKTKSGAAGDSGTASPGMKRDEKMVKARPDDQGKEDRPNLVTSEAGSGKSGSRRQDAVLSSNADGRVEKAETSRQDIEPIEPIIPLTVERIEISTRR
jgi:hypothetical protein